MKREDFIRAVQDRAEGFNMADIKTILDAIEETTFYAIKVEDEIPFKFGKIGGKTVPARDGRNPKTGETVKIAEKKGYPYFKASARAKGKVE